MPRENRKRGKKHKKQAEIEKPDNVQRAESVPEDNPSWIKPAPVPNLNTFDPDAPFGYVDPDVKAYFRTVDTQLRTWQEIEENAPPKDEEGDPNEEKRIFFMAALKEMSGNEKKLSTDPDCSLILERMLYSMDDFVRRVFMDSLSGSFTALVKHRFASHVCQTLFTVASETISRETRGVFPSLSDEKAKGELRTLTLLVVDCCEELVESLPSLLMDSFASHVIRALLLLLSSRNPSIDQTTSNIRSKKSSTWKKRQGPMKSLFSSDKGKDTEQVRQVPPGLTSVARQFVETMKERLSPNEIRALAANQVASPALQMLLEIEAERKMGEEPGSLLDIVTDGLVTNCRNDPSTKLEPSDYLNTLLRDPTSSHLLESIVTCLPDHAFPALWSTYFEGKLGRLANHPLANFVVAKALERVDAAQLSVACTELENVAAKLIKTSRVGVFRSIVERSAKLGCHGDTVCKVILEGFNLRQPQERLLLVPCSLSLLVLEDYQDLNKQDDNRQRPKGDTALEPKIPGALLLQSLLQLPQPHCQLVIESINSLSIEERLKLAYNSISSRIYDALLESPTVPPKLKREFVITFMGHFHQLVDDRIGSRVGDRCWAFADTYLKEKIARSLFNHESILAGSFYGKFFARNLNLHLLQRRPDDWRNFQADRNRTPNNVASHTPPTAITAPSKRKRDVDEIDKLFETNLGRKTKKGALVEPTASPGTDETSAHRAPVEDKSLQDVFTAIRTAPKDARSSKKHKK